MPERCRLFLSPKTWSKDSTPIDLNAILRNITCDEIFSGLLGASG